MGPKTGQYHLDIQKCPKLCQSTTDDPDWQHWGPTEFAVQKQMLKQWLIAAGRSWEKSALPENSFGLANAK